MIEVNQKNRSSNSKATSKAGWVLIISLLISLYFPTSIGGVINPHLTMVGNIVALLCLLLGSLAFGLKFSGIMLAISSALIVLLCLFSFISPYSDITLGAIVPYMTLCLICSLNQRGVVFSKSQINFLSLLVFSLLVFSFLVVFNVKPIIEFQKSYYQVFPDLFDFMVTWANKPVIMFATHSVAGFAFFIVALVSFLFSNVSFSPRKRRWLRLLSLLFSVLLVLLLSNTGFFLFFVMIAIYLAYFLRNSNFVVLCFVALAVLYFVFVNLEAIVVLLADGSKIFFEVILKENNGLLARLSMDSRLAGSYEYVFDSPLVGVGFTYGGNLAFGDNILSEYVLRGGFFGYFLVMVLVIGYLYSNLKSAMAFMLLLFFVLLSDLGYPLFVAFRFVFIFPVLIVLINMYLDLYELKKSKKFVHRVHSVGVVK